MGQRLVLALAFAFFVGAFLTPCSGMAAAEAVCGLSVTADAPSTPQAFAALRNATDPASLYRQGVAYAVGLVTSQDCSAAFDLISRAAHAGYGPAENALGEMYEGGAAKGKSGADDVSATQWYKRASSHGSARGQYNLARLIADGKADVSVASGMSSTQGVWGSAQQMHAAGMDRYAAAAALWQSSADAGDPLAMYRLGQLYASGLGVPQDTAKARELFRRAAPYVPEARTALQELDSGNP